MIAYIEGKLAFKDPTYVIIEANGLGYQIRISLNTFANIKEIEKCRLHTYLHIKEDSHTLFGFFELFEKRIFTDLISISGIGPGTALMLLSSLSAIEVQQAIVNEDIKTIQSAKGIGTKTAQRVILELRDKLKKDSHSPGEFKTIAESSHNTIKNEALSALVTLGIPRAAAEKNIESIIKKEGKEIPVEQLIKMALKTP